MKLNKAEIAEQAGLTMLSRACHSHRFLSDAEIKSIGEAAWVYADAMQTEADKRAERGVPDVIKTEPKQKCEHHHFHWEEVSESKYICISCGKNPNDDSEYLGGLMEGVV